MHLVTVGNPAVKVWCVPCPKCGAHWDRLGDRCPQGCADEQTKSRVCGMGVADDFCRNDGLVPGLGLVFGVASFAIGMDSQEADPVAK